MISSVKIINYLGQSMLAELSFPERSGFLIYNMTGIGPEKAEIRTTDIITADGGVYNSARLPNRNIVLSIRFFSWEGKSVEEIRHESYKYFPIKTPVTLVITTGDRVGEITGYVESNEPVIFSKETHTQISIICPFPYFYDGSDDGTNVTIFYGVEPMFEFPFSNESLTEPLLIMGNILFSNEEVVVYSGDAEIGVTMIIDAIGDVGNLTIYNIGTREFLRIDADKLEALTGSAMVAGDRIIINTVRGQKSITLLRRGIYTNILNVLDKNSSWFQLSKGDNIFAFEAESGTTNLIFRIENRTIYEGV